MRKHQSPIVMMALIAFVTALVSILNTQTSDAQIEVAGFQSLGLAVPAKQVLVRSEIAGHVAKVYFREGEFVKKGELVVKLEAGPAEARRKIAELESTATGQLQNAKATLEVARSNYSRISLLKAKHAASAQEFSEATLRLRQAEASVRIESERTVVNEARFELADAELKKYYLRAPFDGQVVRVHTGIGESITAATNLVRVISLDAFRVDLFVPIARANQFREGQEIQVNIRAPFQRTVDATVLFCSPILEAATGTTRMTIEIDNRELNLASGFTVSLATAETPFRMVASPSEGNAAK